MTDQNELLVNVKKEIRSILLPAQQGLDLSQFLKDYHGLIGRPLPFRELGYQKVEDFLKAVPDVVSLQWSFHTNNYILKAVADESTKHIQKLVQKQKTPSKSKNKTMQRFYRPHGQTFNTPSFNRSLQNSFMAPRFRKINPPPHTFAPRFSSLARMSASQPPMFISSPSVIRPAQSVPIPTAPVIRPTQTIPTPTVPVNQKLPLSMINQEMCDLVKKHTDGIECSNLQVAFKKKYCRDINFKAYDFESLEDYLEQVPGLKPKKSNIDEVLKIVFEGSPKMSSPKPPLNNNLQTNKIYKWLANGEKSLQKMEYLPADELSCHAADDNYYEESSEHDPGISEKLKQEFREILQRNPRGIFARDFLSSFKVYTGNDLNLRTLGYYSLIDFVDTLPDVFTRFQPKNCKSDWLLFDATSKVPQKQISEAGDSPKNQKVLSQVLYSQIITSIRKMLQAYPEGIFLDEFLHLYSLNCDVPLNVKNLGYDSLEQFFLRIEDEVPLKFDYYTNLRPKIFLAYDAVSNVPSTLRRTINTQKVRPNLYEAPGDAVLPNTKYAAQILPALPKGEYMAIYTGTIVNPSIIWIQLTGETTSEELIKVMDKMEQLYLSNESKNYIMRDQDIVVGAVAAGIWNADGNWYRICIVSMDMDFVTAHFVDYGNLGKIPKSFLRYLKKEFMELPAQAIKARMAFLFPIGKQWDMQVRNRLVQLCKDKPVMAEIVDSPQYENTLSLFLCDCNGEKDVYLNLLLVNEGYARYRKDDIPEESAGSFCSSAQNFHLSSSTATNSLAQQTEAIKAMNTLNRLCGVVPPTETTDKVLSLFAQNLNISNPQQVAAHPTWLYGNSSTLVPGNSMSRHSEGSSSLPYQHNPISQSDSTSNYLLSLYLNSIATKDSCNPYSNFEAPKIQQLAAASNCIRPPIHHSQEVSLSAMNDDDCSEIFGDDDDDEFDKMCAEFGCVRRYVQRVNFKFEYQIHIIALADIPYVTAGDLSYLFWPNQAANLIERRLQQNNSSLPSKTVFEEDYPLLFQQLQYLKVKGLVKVHGKFSATLFLLEHVEQILDLFGHPSPAIRSEIKKEFEQFDVSSNIWKSFINIIEDDNDPVYTDSDKFYRMCIYDLKATLEGLTYRKSRCERMCAKDPSMKDHLEKVYRQFNKYDRRIKEIAKFSV